MESKSVIFGRDRWFAENGAIGIENLDTGAFKAITVRDCLMRLQGISEIAKNSKADRRFFGPDTVRKNQAFIEAMIEICREARAQGVFDDPGVTMTRRAHAELAGQSLAGYLPPRA